MQLFKNFISNNNSTEKKKDQRKTRTINNPSRTEEPIQDTAQP